MRDRDRLDDRVIQSRPRSLTPIRHRSRHAVGRTFAAAWIGSTLSAARARGIATRARTRRRATRAPIRATIAESVDPSDDDARDGDARDGERDARRARDGGDRTGTHDDDGGDAGDGGDARTRAGTRGGDDGGVIERVDGENVEWDASDAE